MLDGRIAASSGSTDPLPIASITKLITALVIVDAKPIGPGDDGPTIRFTEADDDLYDKYYVAGATVQSMKAGSTLSERDALELMLVVSASNYAEATATWAFGSPSGFARAARTWLAENGLTGTTIVEPTGLDPRNTSTTADLVAIGKLAMADATIAEIAASRSLDVPGFDRQRNNNDLVGVDGVTGLKTGTLDEAGSCLLFTALVDTGAAAPATVVGVVLGASDRAAAGQAVRSLLASVADGFHETSVVAVGDDLGGYTTAWGDEARVVAGGDATIRVWSDTAITRSRPTAAPLVTEESGAVVGSVTFTAGDETATVPLLLDGDIAEPDGWWRLTHPRELLGW